MCVNACENYSILFILQVVVFIHPSHPLFAFKCRHRPVLTAWIGGDSAAAARQVFGPHSIATYDSPEAAVQAYSHLVNISLVCHEKGI